MRELEEVFCWPDDLIKDELLELVKKSKKNRIRMSEPKQVLPIGIILRTRSHRARSKLDYILGRHPQYWWTWEASAVYAEVTHEEFIRVKEARIKGITKARIDYSGLRRTIKWN